MKSSRLPGRNDTGNETVVILDFVNVLSLIDPMLHEATGAAKISRYGDTIKIPKAGFDIVPNASWAFFARNFDNLARLAFRAFLRVPHVTLLF
jgi:hypothetical protein